ncbi:MAG: FG-GAP-like repeat-containing protein [Pirellulaceae bacterium]|nr:VCBS repeat-containing protein [Planctomycetales bacterium]
MARRPLSKAVGPLSLFTRPRTTNNVFAHPSLAISATSVMLLAGVIAVATIGCQRQPAGPSGGSTATTNQTPPHDTQLSHSILDDRAISDTNRGVALMGRFEYAAAADAFAGVVNRLPASPDAKVNLAIAILNRQQNEDLLRAQSLVAEVLQQQPDHLRARYCSALLAMTSGDTQTALRDFRDVADRDPDDPHAAHFLAQLLEESDPEESVRLYRRAIEIDPYLRSSYYRLFQVLTRQGRSEEARPYLESFQRLANNPRGHLAEIKYTRMGRNAETQVLPSADDNGTVHRNDSGPWFEPARPLVNPSPQIAWQLPGDQAPPSITACDLNHDGFLDLLIPNGLNDPDIGATNAVLLGDANHQYSLDLHHPLATIDHVSAAVWGDHNNDGRVDVFLCRNGHDCLMEQDRHGNWQDIAAAANVAGESVTTADALFVDADHDGDLDLLCRHQELPWQLFHNLRNGEYQAADLPNIEGLHPDNVVQLLACDIDQDRDLDLLAIHRNSPHGVYVNDRLWSYRGLRCDSEIADIRAALWVDLASTGGGELAILDGNGDLHACRVALDTESAHIIDSRRLGAAVSIDDNVVPRLAALDVTGDGQQELIVSTDGGWEVRDRKGMTIAAHSTAEGVAGMKLVAWAPVVLQPGQGPSVIAVDDKGLPHLWQPGAGRGKFASFSFTGGDDQANAMRSNASGIGATAAFRVGSQWTIARVDQATSGPGQSLQPLAIGLGERQAVDFVTIQWPDGVLQTEMNLTAGQHHVIAETQRQLSSCPVLFTWDGERYRFVSDLLGVGGLGYWIAPNEYSTPRPMERFVIQADQLCVEEDRYAIKIHEPMEEVCYVDHAELMQIDLPPGWELTLDERMGISPPFPTSNVVFFKDGSVLLPSAAHNERGEDVLAAITTRDNVAAPPSELDRRFIGRLSGEHQLTLEFSQPLDDDQRPMLLLIDGWIEYPYAQTMFAAWQAGADYRAITIEASDGNNQWHLVFDQIGYPAGMPRQMSVPLPILPTGTRRLRLTTNQEIYYDRISLCRAEPCPNAQHVELALLTAEVRESGFPLRTTGNQRLPMFDYQKRVPLWDTCHLSGYYTEFGDARELIEHNDQCLAIFGPGEELHLEFTATSGELPTGWSRRYVLTVHGWCKDHDLFTQSGDTVTPLPESSLNTDRRDDLHRRFNTRFRAGF